MPEFKAISFSSKLTFDGDDIWCNNLKNDKRNHIGWIKKHYSTIISRLQQMCYNHYNSSKNINIDEYLSSFTLLDISFYPDNTFEFKFLQLDDSIVRVLYGKNHRIIVVK